MFIWSFIGLDNGSFRNRQPLPNDVTCYQWCQGPVTNSRDSDNNNDLFAAPNMFLFRLLYSARAMRIPKDHVGEAVLSRYHMFRVVLTEGRQAHYDGFPMLLNDVCACVRDESYSLCRVRAGFRWRHPSERSRAKGESVEAITRRSGYEARTRAVLLGRRCFLAWLALTSLTAAAATAVKHFPLGLLAVCTVEKLEG